MESLFIVKSSAFEIYRHLRSTGQMRKLAPVGGKLSTPTTHPDAAFDSIIIGNAIQNKPLDLMIKSKSQFHKSNTIKFHLYEKSFPAGSFLQVEKQIYIASPELTFCTLANSLPVEKLIIFGLELCGTYTFNNVEQCVIYGCSQISNTEKLNKYVKALKRIYHGFKGIKNAEYAASFLRNYSASPQESRVYLILGGPRKIGAFGIRGFELNKEIKLSAKAKKIAGQNIIRPDLCIPNNKISIEYDSNQFHDNEGQNIKDKNRLNALKHDKWHTYNFVPDILHSPEKLSNLAIDILKTNKQDTRIKTKGFYTKFNNLLQILS